MVSFADGAPLRAKTPGLSGWLRSRLEISRFPAIPASQNPLKRDGDGDGRRESRWAIEQTRALLGEFAGLGAAEVADL
jgi:hypothetical protein